MKRGREKGWKIRLKSPSSRDISANGKRGVLLYANPEKKNDCSSGSKMRFQPPPKPPPHSHRPQIGGREAAAHVTHQSGPILFYSTNFGARVSQRLQLLSDAGLKKPFLTTRTNNDPPHIGFLPPGEKKRGKGGGTHQMSTIPSPQSGPGKAGIFFRRR